MALVWNYDCASSCLNSYKMKEKQQKAMSCWHSSIESEVRKWASLGRRTFKVFPLPLGALATLSYPSPPPSFFTMSLSHGLSLLPWTPLFPVWIISHFKVTLWTASRPGLSYEICSVLCHLAPAVSLYLHSHSLTYSHTPPLRPVSGSLLHCSCPK